MSLLLRARHFYRSLFRSRQLDHDLDDELNRYAEHLAKRHMAKGLTPAEARRAALVEIGGVEQVKEQVREVRVGWGFETLWRDVRYGCRMIARAPGYAIVIVFTLALVIGANATVFSVMHAVLWQELPYPDADRLVVLSGKVGSASVAGVSNAEALALRAEPGLFSELGNVSSVDAHVTVGDRMERVGAASANDDALQAFGAEPLAWGRVNDADESLGKGSAFNREGYVRTVVISDRLWRDMLGSDPEVIGRHIEVNNLDVEIVGVLRPDFRIFMPASALLPEVVDIWFPRPFDDDLRARAQSTIARLASGVSVADAQARLDVLATRLMSDRAGDYVNGRLTLSARPLQEALTENARPALWALAGVVGFVLLIGCVNVGNLMLARARTRAPEIAIRRALGAGHGRLIRQLFTETTVLVVLGASAGFAFAYAGVSLVDWLRPVHLPRQSQIAVNGPVALFTAGVSVIVSLVFGLLPALQRDVAGNAALHAGRSNVQRVGARRLQRGLVVAEVALSIVPLIAAGLMLRTFINLTNVPLGFDPAGVQTAKVAFSSRAYQSVQERIALYRNAFDRVGQLPGVERVSAGSTLPLDRYHFFYDYGRTTDSVPFPSRATVQSVFPGYLEITGTRLRGGRDFTMDDLTQGRPVVIIDRRIADLLWPEGALGQQLVLSRGKSVTPLEVIGVTNPVRVTGLRDDATPHLFVPYSYSAVGAALVIKTRESAAAIGPEIKRTVEALGTRRPVYDIQPMQAYIDRALGDTRFNMLVLVGFGVASLLLAAVGLYGTLAYLTAQRTQEFGVRMALGASASRVLRSVAGEGLGLTAVGATAGLAGAVLVSSWLGDLLYDVTPFDATTLLAVSGTVALVALVASSYPAWRAAQTDPCTALRAE